MNGAMFTGVISGGTVNASQAVASGNIYYSSGDKLKTDNESSDGKEEKDGVINEDVNEWDNLSNLTLWLYIQCLA
jgi:hypothetical protein